MNRKLRTDSLQELKSATVTVFRIAQAAMEMQAMFVPLWQQAQPDMQANAVKLEQITSAAHILATDVKGMGSEFLAAGHTILSVASALEEVSASVTESVMSLKQAEEEPGAVLEYIEEMVQHIIGQTLRLAALSQDPQIDAAYIRSIIIWASSDVIDEAIDGMLPGQVKYLAEKLMARLGSDNE